ncbi:hypothetical protein Poly30_15710 [Planctomycetes bacterium Poly30]|uniref:N-acetyltransferase domain-containing protein n=1 Tax=Saltatorellus ferox TaxID=2528018 RepID=A0A518EPP8_9BACT|nr:hypothetical protein Poly30_15710 [Planctomycetes bacterium Poly30]
MALEPKRDQGVALRAGTLQDMERLQGMYTKLLAVLARSNPTVDTAHRLQTDWVETPGLLAAWLIERRCDDPRGDDPRGADSREVNSREVGFALVCGKAYAEALGSPTDFLLYEYFIEESERRRGTGTAALERLFAQHPGSWSLDVLPGNLPAMAFWTAALADRHPVVVERVDEEGVAFLRHTFHVQGSPS